LRQFCGNAGYVFVRIPMISTYFNDEDSRANNKAGAFHP